MQRWLYALLVLLGSTTAWSAETMPPAPPQYFNDYANVVSPAVAASLNQQLDQYERETSNQVIVAVFPKMLSDSSLEDYTHRVMESWKVGQRIKNNGVGVFIFIADRAARIEVNYGLEGALPDATSKRIIEDEMLPRFRNKDYEGGLTAGITAIQQAIRGEYKGSGKTVADDNTDGSGNGVFLLFWVFLIGFGYLRSRYSHGGTAYGRDGKRIYSGWWPLIFLGGGMGGGGMGGGGGFSGGGGMGGGGGASGHW